MPPGGDANTPQKPFPILPPDGHRGERAQQSPTCNSHPYAIKTTSTALLSRTNSTGNRAQIQHSYVPTSPFPSPTKKHRFTRSEGVITGPTMLPESPRPLPIPPSLDAVAKDTNGIHRGRSDDGRQRTWSASAGSDRTNASPPPLSPVKDDDLPSNPRLWSTAQLSSYLITALRVRNGDSLPVPPPVTKDIVAFVKDAKLNGRVFLRLSEQDLELMGINHLWRTALLNASRHLRQNVLKGRIWGFDEDENSRSPFMHSQANSSSSSVDSVASLDSTPLKGVRRNGRVRGMVQTIERSSSISSDSSCGSFRETVATNAERYDDDVLVSDGETGRSSPSQDTSGGIGNEAHVKHHSLPKTPPQDPLTDLSGDVAIARQSSEPSIHDLLSTEEMSRSWGAKAWEEFDVACGVTMKRLPLPEHGVYAAANVDVDGAKQERTPLGNMKIPADDIFLKARPLPAPPIPQSGIIDPHQTPTKPVKKHECVQTDVDAAITVNAVSQTEIDSILHQNSAHSSDEELKKALAMLERYRERLAFVEARLAELEHEDESTKRTFVSQTAQTELGADGGSSDTSSSPARATHPVKPGDKIAPTNHTAESDAELNSNEMMLLRSTGGLNPILSSDDLSNHTAISSSREEAREAEESSHAWGSLEQGLSSYVFMVGVGVCAIVIQTLLKRLAGKKV